MTDPKMKPWYMAFFLILPLVLAGCLGSEAVLPSSIDSRSANGESDVGYSWPSLVFTDKDGDETDEPGWFDPETHPHFVEQFVPRVGESPNVIVTGNGTLFVTTYDQVQRSVDGGKNWEVVHDFRHPEFDDRFDSLGPALAKGWGDDRIWLHHLNRALAGCHELYRSDDDGDSWTRPTLYRWPMSCAQRGEEATLYPSAAAPKLFTAPPGPENPPGASSENQFLYLCVTSGALSLTCHVSSDAGETWRSKPVILDDPSCSVIGFARSLQFGTPAVYEDGTVMLPIFREEGDIQDNIPSHLVPDLPVSPDPEFCENRPIVAVTEDSGLSWHLREFEVNLGQVERDPGLTVSEDGTAYLAFRDENHTVQLLRSTDKFATWEGPFQVSPNTHALNSHVGIAGGDPDRIVVMYYGTRTEQDEGTVPSGADVNSVWHLFASVSFNADTDDPTFVTQQVTPRQGPIQVGCVQQPAPPTPHYGDCANLGTSVDMTRGADGRAYGVFVDGCTIKNGCVGDLHGAWSGRESQVAVAVQDSGQSLFANEGTLDSLGLAFPRSENNEVEK